MRDMAVDATYNGQPLPVQYEIYYRRWFMLGWPAFIGVLIIFYLMVAKPALDPLRLIGGWPMRHASAQTLQRLSNYSRPSIGGCCDNMPRSSITLPDD
jgi:hypothetical protein